METMEKTGKRLVAKAARFKVLVENIAELEVERAALGADLMLLIPAGSEAEGLQHQVSNKFKPVEKELRRLGHWNTIVKEAVDTEKLKALVKLMPALVDAGAVEVVSSDRLVVKRGE